MLSKLSYSIILLAFLILAPLNFTQANEDKPTITVGSKRFSENFIIAEIFAQLLEDNGYPVVRKFSMGGSVAAFYALKTHELDVYPDYSGTIAQSILKTEVQDFVGINQRLKKHGLEMLKPLGLNNSYSLVMKPELAKELGIETISDLKDHPELRGAVSFEFQERTDGWQGLKKLYSLSNPLTNLDVPLNYEALRNDRVDFAEAYTTEPLVEKYNFKVLEDNEKFFPKYLAVPLVHDQIPSEVRKLLNSLAGRIDDQRIRKLTGLVNDGKPIPFVANKFLTEDDLVSEGGSYSATKSIQWSRMLTQTKNHLFLTGLAVLLATLVAVPLATVISSRATLSKYVLGFTGVLQTIPSIALLTFMIPFFGIGFTPAIIGLFIYSLLPILRNTHTAMTSIDPRLITSAKGIGLYPFEIFFSVKLPLAFPTIMAGIRTATILNIGTATLAAFIGAGGLGVPIVTGLALNDTNMVLQGAIPAALLAVFVDFLFSMADRYFTKAI